MSDAIVTKRCSKCNEVKAVEEFHKDRTKLDGVREMCKECTKRLNQAQLQARRKIVPQTKQCSRCKTVKPAFEFHRDRCRTDGLCVRCKSCIKAHQQQPHVKEQQRQATARYRKTDNGKAKEKAYKTSEGGRQGQHERLKRYAQTEHGRRKIREKVKRQRLAAPEKTRARKAVYKAIRWGRIPPVHELTCRYCSNQAEQYHHPSYAREHRMTIVPVCRDCHQMLHAKGD